MRISDWSSDVCSSDLRLDALGLDEFLDLGRAAPDAGWGGFPESRACSLFYTSGTTSAPKGVLYSHRSCLLNAMLISLGLELNTDETLMPVVPLFHANGWGFGHIAPMLGTAIRSEEHTSELQSLMRISYAVFCLKKKKKNTHISRTKTT